MALQFLKSEETKYFEMWENSPRLPKSIQKQLAGLSADEKLKAAAPYYIEHQDVLNISRAMSAIGYSPIEISNGVNRDGHIVLFDGNRRLLAANLLLNPELADGIEKTYREEEEDEPMTAKEILQRWRDGMSDELLDTLREIPVVEFHSAVYTLESASLEVAKRQFA